MRKLLVYAMYGGITMTALSVYAKDYDGALVKGAITAAVAIILLTTKSKHKT